MTAEQQAMLDEIAKLKAENAALKTGISATLGCKIGEKGGVSVTGLGRFPTTLYKEQWLKLAKFMPTVEKFIEAHAAELKSKGDAPREAQPKA